MKNKRRTTAIRKVLGYRAFFVVNIALLLIIGMSVGREFVRSAAIKREIAALEMERAAWEEQKVSLEAYEDYLNTEAFLEKEAREKFGLQRPGEQQVFIDEETALAVAPVGDVAQVEESVSPATLWMWYFFRPDAYKDHVDV